MSFTMFETSRLVALLLCFSLQKTPPVPCVFFWFVDGWYILGPFNGPSCHWCGLGLGLVRWMELIIFISLVEVLASQLLALLVSPWQVDFGWSLGWEDGWMDGFWTYGNDEGAFCWKTRGILHFLQGSLGMYLESSLKMNHGLGAKIWKIRKQHWMDWQIHLDSPSYHRFWSFRISHMFTQFLPMRRKWDPLMGLKKRLWSIINHPFFATPARNERSKVLWHGVPQAQLRERQVVTWSEKRWEGKMSWGWWNVIGIWDQCIWYCICMAVFDIGCANLVYF